MEKGKKKILSEAADLFDLPADMLAGLPHVEMMGDSRFYMENHRGILSYSDREIAISGEGMILRIKGENLVLTGMTGHALRIQGEIQGLEWVK